MANWPGNRCGNCGLIAPEAIEQKTCPNCGRVCCPACGPRTAEELGAPGLPESLEHCAACRAKVIADIRGSAPLFS